LGNTCSTVVGNLALVIRSTGACTIAGTLSLSATNTTSATSLLSGGGGGGGGGTAAGTAGKASGVGVNQAVFIAGGLAGALTGGNGGNGTSFNTASAAQQQMFVQEFAQASLYNGPPGGVGGTGSAAGGSGGGIFVLNCPTIDFTGLITADGNTGASATANSNGAGGGGAGGYTILSAGTYTNNTGAIQTVGGQGGQCINPAIVLTPPATGNASTGLGAFAHVSTFAAGNPTVVTVDTAGSLYNYTPACAVTGTGGGANTGSGATCTVTMAGSSPAMTVSSIAVTGGNGGYGTGTTFTTCGLGGYGGNGGSRSFTIQ